MNNRYSFTETISTGIALLLTKIFYKHARLIRRPIYIRGKSSLSFAKGFTTGHFCRFDLLGGKKKLLIIGLNCEIGDSVHIVAHERVIIGDNVLIASKVFISDTNHGSYSGNKPSSPKTPPNRRPLVTKPILIGNNVWIGENVCVLPGVTIGDGCIIGANSVVNKNIPDNCIAVGVPAKVIKEFNDKKKLWMN
ncbi:MAG: DapH/DapD/GlmU-related protein [Carnobacterium sp.]|uniref:DapH/DapD/GlmU-related protein n=1 Tax=Carnobacterium sp. TaxID=48221 RepID=UPI003C717624